MKIIVFVGAKSGFCQFKLGYSSVPVAVFSLSFKKLFIFSTVSLVSYVISGIRNVVREFLSFLLIKGDVPGADEVRDEADETVPRRTDRHIWEVNLSDGQGLDGGGDGTVGPAREGLLDQDEGSSEASDDDTDPEQSDQPSVSSYVVQTMDGGGLQELLPTSYSNHTRYVVCWQLNICWAHSKTNNKYVN